MTSEFSINSPDLWRAQLPKITPDGHKYDRGYVIIIGGEVMTGAARLVARASARIGAGLTAIASVPDALSDYRQAEPHLIIMELPDYKAMSELLLTDQRHQTFVIGPGFGRLHDEDVIIFTRATLQEGRVLVLDADGLNAFAGQADALNIRANQRLIITPHAGEFKTLFGFAPDDRAGAALQAAKMINGVVVLKGHETVIAGADGRAVVNTNAPATLATAGSGDVLAGLIAGLCARGMDTFDAACAAVWIHGAAASLFGPAGLVATDLPDLIPEVLQTL